MQDIVMGLQVCDCQHLTNFGIILDWSNGALAYDRFPKFHIIFIIGYIEAILEIHVDKYFEAVGATNCILNIKVCIDRYLDTTSITCLAISTSAIFLTEIVLSLQK